jgi:Fic family protein
MSSQESIKAQELAILKALEKLSEGASLDEIKKEARLEIDVRILQRRLNNLRNQGKILRSGKTRATRYHLIAPTESKELQSGRIEPQITIPISEDGKKILAIITQPETQRMPVGYQREFLESYRPNIDFYLSEVERKNLAKLARTATPSELPAGTYAKEILQRLLIDLSWNSSRMEGNTYSLLETERLIALGEVANNKSAAEAQMILNHKDAIEFIVQSADEIGYNRYTILNLHALLSNNLLPDPAAPGRLRNIPVGIKKPVYTPLSIPQLIEEMFELILEKARVINDPFEQAFFIMVHIPYLQPFEDVNKRVSRLAANIALNRDNLVPLSFVDTPSDLYIQGLLGVYEINKFELFKDVFLWAYDRSSARYAALRQSMGEPDPFRLKYRSTIKELITEIISKALSQETAIELIRRKALELPEKDQSKFVEAVETELLNLHEGNFARYYIRPSEFKVWKEAWSDSKRAPIQNFVSKFMLSH